MAKSSSPPARSNPAAGPTNARPAAPASPAFISTWVKVPLPNGDVLHKAGKPIELGDYIKVSEAAKLLDLSVTRIHDLIQSGEIPPDAVRRPGSPKRGSYRILRSVILARLGPASTE